MQVLPPSRTAHNLHSAERNSLVLSEIHYNRPRTRHSCIVRLQKTTQEAVQEAVRSDGDPRGADQAHSKEGDETLSEDSREITERIGEI